MHADQTRRLSLRLLLAAGAITGAAFLLLFLQPKQTVDVTLGNLGMALFYLAWLVLLVGVASGFRAWFRGSRTWWTLVGLVFLAGLTWFICAIATADLS